MSAILWKLIMRRWLGSDFMGVSDVNGFKEVVVRWIMRRESGVCLDELEKDWSEEQNLGIIL